MAASHQEVNLLINGVYAQAVAEAEAVAQELAQRLRDVCACPIPSEKAAGFLETIYAGRGYFSEEVLAAAAEVGSFASEWGFSNLSEDARGYRMVAFLLGRGSGEPPVPAWTREVEQVELPPEEEWPIPVPPEGAVPSPDPVVEQVEE